MFHTSNRYRRFLVASTLVGMCCCASGCTTWGYKSWGWGKSKEEGFSEEDKKFTEGLRPRDSNSAATATTQKGRDIERSLGYGN
jgi:hypothetical protein